MEIKQHVLLVNLFCIVSVLKTIYNNEKYLKTLKEKDYKYINDSSCIVIVQFIRRDQKQSSAVCL